MLISISIKLASVYLELECCTDRHVYSFVATQLRSYDFSSGLYILKLGSETKEINYSSLILDGIFVVLFPNV